VITPRRALERGHFDHGWLDTYHTFSFDQYYDPGHMGFGDLRVINEDRVDPGHGFPTHGHRDMEILTYVLEGALEHRDSMGNGSVIRPGDVQRMTAGTGVRHSESNPSRDEAVHLLQIWILPDRKALEPEYEQRFFTPEEKEGRLRLVASADGRDGSLRVHQDVSVYASVLRQGASVAFDLASGRRAWLQVVRGEVLLNETPLAQGDGAGVTDEKQIRITAAEPSEVLLFDLA